MKKEKGVFKRYKLLILLGFIILFFMFMFISKMQLKNQIKHDEIPVSYKVQREAYNSYQLALEEAGKEGDKRFPEKRKDQQQNKRHKEFFKDYMNKASYNIEQYYNINTKTLAQIIIKGDNELWPNDYTRR
ncbi:MAG: hypothetical protein GY750_16340 [Lentisphaerae bacterium]|nr:hypothetical protein [Lentisphaerota bacterium]